MKKLLLIGLLLGVFGGLQAQNLEITATSPANGAVDVDQDSISVTFNKKIKLDESTFEEGVPVPFLFLPIDSVDVSQIRLSPDSMTVIFDVTLTDNTDFSVVILDAESEDGDRLERPYKFRFTTNATAGEFVVQGMVEQEQLKALKQQSQFNPDNGLAVFLSQEELGLGFEFDEVDEDSLEDDPDPFRVSHLAFVDPETGEYSIDGIREGDFFAIGFNIFTIEQDEDEFFPDLYIHDEDEDFALDTIAVNSTNAPSDTLENIFLRLLRFDPFTFNEAIERTTSLGFGQDIDLLAGQTDIPLTEAFFEPKRQKVTLKGLPFSASVNDEPDNPFFDHKQGKSIFWNSFFYNETEDVLYAVGITPFGAQVVDTLSAGEADIPVPFNSINPLPETIIDSDSAARIAQENGGIEFVNRNEDADFSRVEFLAAHEYWQYPLDNTVNAPTIWKVSYYADYFDFEFSTPDHNDGFEQDSLIFYIDIETGEILYKAGAEVEGGPDFNVISSSPADGDFDVTENFDIAITFDAPVRLEDFGEGGMEILTFPFDSLEINDVRLADQGRTLVFTTEHTPDTDFTWIVSRATNTGGGQLERPYVFNYTTAASNSANDVSGEITDSGLAKSVIENEYDGILVALFSSNPFVERDDDFDENNDGTEGPENEGPEFTIARAALVDTTDGTYTIEGVRDGTYFPLAINLIRDSFSSEPTAIGIYDPEGDGTLNSIEVSGGSVSGIGIEFKEFAPISAKDAVTIGDAIAASLDSDLELYFMFTEEDLYEDDFEECEFDCEDPKKIIGNKLKQFSDNLTPSGRGEAWGLLYYNSTSETAVAMGVNPFGAGFVDTVDTEEFIEDLDLPDEATIDALSPLSTTGFFDSDSAAIVAEENGGSDFRSGDSDFIYVNYLAINTQALLPPNITAENGVWAVIYGKNSFTEFGPDFEELVLLIDFEDGSFLGSFTIEEEGITALEARESADDVAQSVHSDNELYLINAQALLQRDPELDTLFFEKAKVPTEIDSSGLRGEFSFIDFRYYSSSAEEEIGVFVDFDGNADFFTPGFSFIPENVSFSDLEPISSNIIDSDSAISIASTEGGADFLANLGTDFDIVRSDIHAQAGNRFWEYPEGVDSSIVTWNIIFNRISFNRTTEEYEFENATYFLDAESGAVLAEQIKVSNEDETDVDIPVESRLGQNYPNPFNPSTTIPFALKSAANVELTIYNMLGQKVATIINNQRYNAGQHSVNWNASALASGMYIYRITAGDYTGVKKLMLIK